MVEVIVDKIGDQVLALIEVFSFPRPPVSLRSVRKDLEGQKVEFPVVGSRRAFVPVEIIP